MYPPPVHPPELIQDEDLLRTMVTALRAQPHVAVDTESNSLFAYQEQVCLIQFSIPEGDYLVDPLSLPDLSLLSPLFANPTIEKVFHGAEYDVMCLKRDFGFAFSNLFDTRVAIRTLGRKRSGLRDVLADELGISVDKKYQRANWGKRPLPQDLLDYARLDTYYLLELRHHLALALREFGHLEEAREANDYIAGVDAHDNGFDPEGFWRIRHARDLNDRQLAVLRELYLFRNAEAHRQNRPAFKVIGNKTLLAIAQASPESHKMLRSLSGMTPGQVQRYGKGILAAVDHGLQAPIPHKARGKPTDEMVQMRFDTLRQWRKQVASDRKVESDIIMPRDLLWEIAQTVPHNAETLWEVMSPMKWRFQTYSQDILKLLKN